MTTFHKITKFDKATCKVLGFAAQKALAELAEQHGLSIDYAGGTLDDLTFTMRLKCKVQDTGAQETHARDQLAQWARLFDIPADSYGKIFESNGRTFRLLGIEPDRPKFPFIGERVPDGKRFKFGASIAPKIRAAK